MLDRDEIEDSLLFFRQTVTRTWWNLYQGCLDQGFDNKQAFVLVQTYILGNGNSDLKPPDADGPGSDDPDKET
jgi:hypothetical protein